MKRIELPLFLLIFLYVPNFYFLDWPIFIQYFKYLIFLLLISILCLLRILSWFGKKQKLKVSIGTADLLLILFLLAYILSTLLSTDRYISIFGMEGGNQEGLIFFLGLMLLFYFSQFYLKTRECLLAFCFATAFGLFISFTIEVFRYGGSFNHFINTRIIGAEHHPVYYGIYLLVGAIISLGLFTSAKNWGKVVLRGFIALLLFLILATGARGVWGALLASSLVALAVDLKNNSSVVKKVLRNSQTKTALLFLVTIFFLLIVAWSRPFERINDSFASVQKDPSATIRFLEWKGAWKVFTANFFWGRGPGSISYTYPREREQSLGSLKGGEEELILVRNVYLNYLANLGLLPSLLAFTLFFFIFISAVRFLQIGEGRKLIWVFFWAWLSLLLVHLFYHYTVTSAIFFWTLSGMLVYWTKSNLPIKVFTVPKALTALLPVTAGLLISLAIVFFAASFYAETLFIKGVRQENLLLKIQTLSQVLTLVPWDAQKWRILSMWEFEMIKTSSSKSLLFQDYVGKSLNHMEKAHSLSPSDLNISHDLGVLYFRVYVQTKKKELLEASGEYLKMTYEAYPTKLSFADDLGEYYLAEGDLQKAEEYFRRTLSLQSTYAPGYYHLGEVYKQRGKFDEAKEWYKKSLKFWDNLPFVEVKIKEIEALQKGV